MALDMNNPSIRIGADCVRQLIDCITRLIDCHDAAVVAKDVEDVYADSAMAVREAKEWIGEEPDCEGGVCRL